MSDAVPRGDGRREVRVEFGHEAVEREAGTQKGLHAVASGEVGDVRAWPASRAAELPTLSHSAKRPADEMRPRASSRRVSCVS